MNVLYAHIPPHGSSSIYKNEYIFIIHHCPWLILTNGAPPPPIHAHCTTVYALLILMNIHTHFIIFILWILNLKFIISHNKLLKSYQAAQISNGVGNLLMIRFPVITFYHKDWKITRKIGLLPTQKVFKFPLHGTIKFCKAL